MSALPHYGADPHVLRLAKVLRHLLDRETFTTIADLKDAFAATLAGYHIPYEGWDLNDAFALVGSNRPLIERERPRRLAPAPEPPPPISATEARALIAAHHLTIRTMAGQDTSHEARVRAQADEFRGRGGDPVDERTRERRASAHERIAWERQITESNGHND
jgi:hypothetical protein